MLIAFKWLDVAGSCDTTVEMNSSADVSSSSDSLSLFIVGESDLESTACLLCKDT